MSPAEMVLDRASKLNFPPIVANGTIVGSPAAWWRWSLHAPVAEIEAAHRQLDQVEKRAVR